MSALPSIRESAFMNSLRAIFAVQVAPAAEQRKAWELFNQLGLPALRDEHWKYTQLHRLYSQSFAALQTTQSLPAADGVVIRQVNTGAFKTDRPFIALNHALNAQEWLIEVPDNMEIRQPLWLDMMAGGISSIIAPRLTIKLGRNSKLTVIERYRSNAESMYASIAVTHVTVGENARLEHCRLQDANRASFHIGSIDATIGQHGRYVNHYFNTGGSVGRLDVNVQLQGAEAYAELNGLQFATGNQVLDTHSRIEHCVPRARSSETYHGIADERGQVVFNGKVLVHKHAIGTDAQQSSRNLLLSPKAEIDTKPELEIYADDVKCSHGATVGQLDSNALFYLRSRGISEQEARALLTLAFADAVINKVSLDSLREDLTQQVHARFGNKAEPSV